MKNYIVRILPGALRDAYEDKTEKYAIRCLALVLPFILLLWLPFYSYTAYAYFSPLFTKKRNHPVPQYLSAIESPVPALKEYFSSRTYYGLGMRPFPKISTEFCDGMFAKKAHSPITEYAGQLDAYVHRHLGTVQLEALLAVVKNPAWNISVASYGGNAETMRFRDAIADSVRRRGFSNVIVAQMTNSENKSMEGVTISEDKASMQYRIAVYPMR